MHITSQLRAFRFTSYYKSYCFENIYANFLCEQFLSFLNLCIIVVHMMEYVVHIDIGTQCNSIIWPIPFPRSSSYSLLPLSGPLYEHIYNSLGYIPRSEIAGSYDNSILKHSGNSKTVLQRDVTIYIHTSILWVSIPLVTSANIFVWFFYILVVVKEYIIFILICLPMNTEYFSMYLSIIYLSSEKCPLKIVAYSLIGLYDFVCYKRTFIFWF